MNNRPEKIYKYMSMDTFKIILKDQTLKFSLPTDFNDPFDCDVDLVGFDFNGRIDNQVAKELEYIKYLHKDDINLEAKLKDPSFLEKIYRGGQVKKIASSRVSCFSLQYDIVMMWSHYADKHNGVCLEFDNSLENRFVNLTDKDFSEAEVEYKSHERINYVSVDRVFAVRKLFMNKAESWSYEREYRIVLLNNKHEIQKFHPRFLLSVYFGLKVTDDEIASFDYGFSFPEFKHLKFYKGGKVKNKLEIQFSPTSII